MKKSTSSTPTSPATEAKPAVSKFRPWMWWVASVASFVIIGGAIVVFVAYQSAGTKIIRGASVAGVDVGRLDSLTAINLLQKKWDTFSAQAFQFSANGKTSTILVANDSASDTAVVLSSVGFDPKLSIDRALSFGRRGNWWQQVRERTSGYFGRHHELGVVTVNEQEIQSAIVTAFQAQEQPAKNIGLTVDTNGKITTTPSQTGSTFDYQRAADQAVQQSHLLNGGAIVVPTVVAQPTTTDSAAVRTVVTAGAKTLLDRAPFTLNYADRQWSISREQLRKLVGLVGTTAAPRLGFDTTATTKYLNTIATDLNVKAQNAKFTIVDGQAKEFQPSVTGITLNFDKTIQAMQADLIDAAKTTATIAVDTDVPMTDTASTNQLGISEIVGEASTNFGNSPANRKYNLTYGASLLNGLLIQPGEEFSLVKALGIIDDKHGWKPELVILGSSIKPEFGGGLCQVATTLFRTALNAGLPITERHNHSLRISYYEPPVGLDATIYDPQPDLRFVNDYKTPLLLETSVTGKIIDFKFYGTTDGRTVDILTPKVYNQVPIPATKTVEVTDLKPGEEECQKPGHPGADATATYTVTKADGTKVTQTFQSHYRAIGVICRVGKAAQKSPAPTPVPVVPVTNTTTPTNTTPPVETGAAPVVNTNTAVTPTNQ